MEEFIHIAINPIDVVEDGQFHMLILGFILQLQQLATINFYLGNVDQNGQNMHNNIIIAHR